MITKIVSGGQTGVDRASLDTAILLDIPHGGWCPKGRKAEDGVISSKYDLKETPSDDYSERTRWNIRDSDGTLILVGSLPLKVTDGTILTIDEVQSKQKPHLIINLSNAGKAEDIIEEWVKKNNIKILNIAGPRESQHPGIYQLSCILLKQCFKPRSEPKVYQVERQFSSFLSAKL